MQPNAMDCDTPEALRFLASACDRPVEGEWMRAAADEIERLRGRVVRLPWTRGDWAGTVDMIAYRGMVAEALDAAGVKWEMEDG